MTARPTQHLNQDSPFDTPSDSPSHSGSNPSRDLSSDSTSELTGELSSDLAFEVGTQLQVEVPIESRTEVWSELSIDLTRGMPVEWSIDMPTEWWIELWTEVPSKVTSELPSEVPIPKMSAGFGCESGRERVSKLPAAAGRERGGLLSLVQHRNEGKAAIRNAGYVQWAEGRGLCLCYRPSAGRDWRGASFRPVPMSCRCGQSRTESRRPSRSERRFAGRPGSCFRSSPQRGLVVHA